MNSEDMILLGYIMLAISVISFIGMMVTYILIIIREHRREYGKDRKLRNRKNTYYGKRNKQEITGIIRLP